MQPYVESKVKTISLGGYPIKKKSNLVINDQKERERRRRKKKEKKKPTNTIKVPRCICRRSKFLVHFHILFSFPIIFLLYFFLIFISHNLD